MPSGLSGFILYLSFKEADEGTWVACWAIWERIFIVWSHNGDIQGKYGRFPLMKGTSELAGLLRQSSCLCDYHNECLFKKIPGYLSECKWDLKLGLNRQ